MPEGLKINAGCGRTILDGWVNVDLERSPYASRDPDIFADVRRIPLPDNCASELMAIHVFEHFYYWEVEELLKEWARLLQIGGKLILELPDIKKAARNLLDGLGDEQTMWPLYGDPKHKNPLMCHRWGWTFSTIKPLLKRVGFSQLRELPTQFHGTGRERRDFRVEGIKL